MWKDRNKELGSSKQHSIWILIKNKIDATGKPKTVKQIKTKIRNLKGAYKACKDNNKKTSRSSTFAHIFKTLTRFLEQAHPKVLTNPDTGLIRGILLVVFMSEFMIDFVVSMVDFYCRFYVCRTSKKSLDFPLPIRHC